MAFPGRKPFGKRMSEKEAGNALAIKMFRLITESC